MQPTPNTQMADSASNNSTDSSLSLVCSLHPNPQNTEHLNMTHSLQAAQFKLCSLYKLWGKQKNKNWNLLSSVKWNFVRNTIQT
jgi:hypothetical protein